MAEGAEAAKAVRSAGEAGWHASRYNLFAKAPDTNRTIIVNLFKGTCAEYSPIETHLLSVIERLRENHPMVEPLARRGLITSFDERSALETMGRAACAAPMGVTGASAGGSGEELGCGELVKIDDEASLCELPQEGVRLWQLVEHGLCSQLKGSIRRAAVAE